MQIAPVKADIFTIGFAVVGSYESQDIQDAQSTAYEQMLNWIKNH